MWRKPPSRLPKFLSMLSLRRATGFLPAPLQGCIHFYPRSPCGERRDFYRHFMASVYFYPRSPCGERRWHPCQFRMPRYFYPRSPCGERPAAAPEARLPAYFYPRSPCGERQAGYYRILHRPVFLSTLSLRRATQATENITQGKNISIHALLAESDRARAAEGASARNFYPRSPCGERPTHADISACKMAFLSTLSLRRATPGKTCRYQPK